MPARDGVIWSVQARPRADQRLVAAFLRRLGAELPGVGLLQVSEDRLTHYRDTIATGTARAGSRHGGPPPVQPVRLRAARP
ncbi:hypothetical protein [Streptosporangium roseum]|uniref:hypothetical protein n=1 Tax=Streptosporangium roseum TaxID=2001 RepID=UPI0033317C80